jgi:hypothetical protein
MPSVLIVDDLLSIHEMLDAVIQPTGFATAFRDRWREGAGRYKAGEVRSGAGGHRHEADGRHHAAQAAEALRSEVRRHHHDGLRLTESAIQALKSGRVRLPAEAVSASTS